MPMKMQRGQKTDITKGNNNLHYVDVVFEWTVEKDKDVDIDISAFLLQQDGKVAADDDFIFYGNINHASGCVAYRSDRYKKNTRQYLSYRHYIDHLRW